MTPSAISDNNRERIADGWFLEAMSPSWKKYTLENDRNCVPGNAEGSGSEMG